jgi:hypothetical protein
MDIAAKRGLTTVMNRVDLPETGCFSFRAGVEGADGDTAFQGTQGVGETFPRESEGFLVLFEVPVNGRRTYGGEFFRDFGGDGEGRPS